VTADPFGLEADHFSAGPLMPAACSSAKSDATSQGWPRCRRLPRPAAPRAPRRPSATRRRPTRRVAAIVSTGPTIDHCSLSEAMKSLPDLRWIRKGTPLPSGTLTAALASNAQRVLDGDRDDDEVDATDWLGGTKSARVSEEVLGLGRYGKVLTLLHSSDIGLENESDEEHEVEELRESWTPRPSALTVLDVVEDRPRNVHAALGLASVGVGGIGAVSRTRLQDLSGHRFAKPDAL
jgi:hypothetical protein